MGRKSISYEDKFKQLQNLLLGAYETFYVWKALQKEEYNELFPVSNAFWVVTLPALQHEWFMGLARLFEDSSYSKSGAVVSVYSLIQEHPLKERTEIANDFLNKNKVVINNIARIRDYRHAHNNADFLINSKDFEKRFPIKYGEIEDIFEFTDKMLGILHPEDGHGYSLDHMKEEAERHTSDVMVGLKYFYQKREEYRRNWITTRQGKYEFPPEE
jgi:hypothetical protein